MSQQQRTFRDVPFPGPVHALLTKNNADTSHDAFITHLDRSSVRDKVYIFMIPFAFNLLLASIVIWRTLSTGYYALLSIVFGELMRPQSTWNVSWPRYIITLFFDVVVYTQIPPILKKFATGHLWMRLRYGFRPVEIVFRKPTGAKRLQINSLPPEEFQTAYMNSILHAIDPRLINNNVGYNTRDGFWVLEYKSVIDAYKLAQTGDVSIETWEVSVWQKIEGKWCVWPVHEQNNSDVQGRAMELFMQKLSSIGRQDILDEWVATLQTQDQSQVMAFKDIQRLDALLANAGLNFTTLWNEALQAAQRTPSA